MLAIVHDSTYRISRVRRIDVAKNVSFHAIDASLKEKVIMLQAGISPI
jgi:hypothetical protein